MIRGIARRLSELIAAFIFVAENGDRPGVRLRKGTG